MAKAKRGRRGHRTGSVITTRRLNGLGNIKQPSSFAGAVVPPLAAGVVTGGAAIAAEQMLTPGEGFMGALHEWSPIVGIAAGGLASLGLMFMAGRPQALAGFTTSLVVGGTLFVKRYLDSAPMTSGLGRGRRQYNGQYMGAVVAEQLAGLPSNGVGAIVMEPYGQQGYGNSGGGEKVSLGAIDPNAFGTTGFNL